MRLAPEASAAPGGYCADDKGVTVVVDLGDLDPDASVVVRCADNAAGDSGLDALSAAGLTFTMPARFPGMICRLGGAGAQRPAPGEVLPVDGDTDYVEACVNAPPTRAYWSYWYADEGGRWTYSSAGPSSRTVIAGGFEGWSFSLNRSASAAPPPRVSPDNPNAPYEEPTPPSPEPQPNPQPSPQPSPQPNPQPSPDSGTNNSNSNSSNSSPEPSPEPSPGPSPEPTQAAPAPQAQPSRPTPTRDRPAKKPDRRQPDGPQRPKASRGADEPSRAPSASRTPRSADSGVRVTDDVDTSASGQAADPASGPPASTWWGLGAVAGIGAVAVGMQRRRRSGEHSP